MTSALMPRPGQAVHADAAGPPLREVRGVVERITYQNPDNGYTVARLAQERTADGPGTAGVTDDDRLMTLVGTLADLTPGEAIQAHGWWRNDPKHGWQFQAQDYRTVLPATLQGMKKYLGSGLVKGVGPIMGGRIVETFGETTFDVIDAAPERLTAVPGIGPVRARRIAETWEEQRHIREVMAALQGYGVSTSLAVRIYKKFGNDSGRIVSREPYRLAREVWGIGFKTADRIAQSVGIATDAPERLQAGVLHALSTLADDGHTLVPETQVINQAAALLGVDSPPLRNAIAALLDAADVVAAHRSSEAVARLIALAPFARAESGLASRLRGLANAANRSRAGQIFQNLNWSAAFDWLAGRHGLHLAPEQASGVRMALTTPVSILTGGPGTGKTHTLKAVLMLAQAKQLRCLLAAPTGRAAKRMEEATGLSAVTLHRLLDLRPGSKSADKTLVADLVVVDEVSMLDVLLANHLVKAVPPGAHLLLVGDPDQLPSVGAGDVLADLLRSERFPVTRLMQIFRQGAGSGIAENARRINAGQMPTFGSDVRDCFFLPAEDATHAAELVADLVAFRLPDAYGFRPGEVQVLSPMHRGEAGVGALNTQLQNRLNPRREGIVEARVGGRVYRAGDRVLQLRNDYDLEMYNGDLGTVRSVDPTEQVLDIMLDDGREVCYPYASAYALTHAYAATVHKVQGAEFPAVVIVLLTSHVTMLGRTLIYTALTRARRLAVFVGQKRALALAVRDWQRTPRQTALAELLVDGLHFSWHDVARGTATIDDDTGRWEGLLEAAADPPV
jgi:exodeoxyribonuclease V alpha subunit